MSASVAESLGLDLEIAQTRCTFLERYADDVLEDRDRYDVRTAQGIRASALLDAAQLAWMIDEDDALHLLQRAATSFRNAGSTYGFFLSAVYEPSDIAIKTVNGSIDLLHYLARAPDDSDMEERFFDFRDTNLEPPQLMYMALAMVLQRESEEYYDQLKVVLDELSGQIAYPIGPYGFSVASYAQYGLAIINGSRSPFPTIEYVAETLARYSAAWEASTQLARSNEYLWKTLRSNVQLVDFDLMAMVAMSSELTPDYHPSLRSGLGELAALASDDLIRVRNQWRY